MMRVFVAPILAAFTLFGLGCVEDNPGAGEGADAMVTPDAGPPVADAHVGDRDARVETPDSEIASDATAPLDGATTLWEDRK